MVPDGKPSAEVFSNVITTDVSCVETAMTSMSITMGSKPVPILMLTTATVSSLSVDAATSASNASQHKH